MGRCPAVGAGSAIRGPDAGLRPGAPRPTSLSSETGNDSSRGRGGEQAKRRTAVRRRSVAGRPSGHPSPPAQSPESSQRISKAVGRKGPGTPQDTTPQLLNPAWQVWWDCRRPAAPEGAEPPRTQPVPPGRSPASLWASVPRPSHGSSLGGGAQPGAGRGAPGEPRVAAGERRTGPRGAHNLREAPGEGTPDQPRWARGGGAGRGQSRRLVGLCGRGIRKGPDRRRGHQSHWPGAAGAGVASGEAYSLDPTPLALGGRQQTGAGGGFEGL